jgi:hypothetical protein
MRIKVEIGQLYRVKTERWLGTSLYRIVYVGMPGEHSTCVCTDTPHIIVNFRITENDGLTNISGLILVKAINEKVIPDMPLDPTLPILTAGHLQDRQRKRFK